VPLPLKVFETLLALVQKSGEIVEKDELMQELWPDTIVEESNLTQNVFTLRKALGESKNDHHYIETVPRRGYRFVAVVKELPDEGTERVEKDTRGRIVAEEASGRGEVKGSDEPTAQSSETVASGIIPSTQYSIAGIKHYKWGAVVGLATLLITVIAIIQFNGTNPAKNGEAIDSVAVLPFVNVNADPNTEYLTDGVSDSIINSLSRLPNLRVMSLSSVLRYKGQQVNPQAVGRELNVRAVLMGRLIQQGEGFSISTELVDVRDSRRLWGQQYNRKLGDLLQVREEISREISERLQPRLSGEQKRQLAQSYTESSEAYQLYLLGRYHWRKLTKEGFEKSLEYYEQAIRKDPSYAPAYFGQAVIYSELGLRGLMPPKEVQQKAESATLKALQLDDTLAEAHVSLGYIKKRDWDWAVAEKELKRALELNPSSAPANSMYSIYLRDIGRPDEALAYAKRAFEIDGPSPKSIADLGDAYYNARQYDQAIGLYLKAIEMDPNFAPAHARLGAAYLAKGMYREAIEELQKAKALDNSPERQGRFAWLAYAYAVSGQRAEAQKMLDELQETAKQRYIPPYNFALIYTGLGERDQAFLWLEKAYEEHAQNLTHLKANPMFDSLRSDPRFTDLLRRIGLAP